MTQHAPSSAAIAEYYGLFIYASMGSFNLLAQDAANAPSIRDRMTLSRMAAAEIGEIERVEDRIVAGGRDVDVLLESYRDLMSDFLLRAVPRDWWERLVRTYVGYHVLQDLLQDLAGQAGETVQEVTHGTFASIGHADWTVAQLEPVLAAESQLSARLALWGRRVAGEALTLVRRLFVDHPVLLELVEEDDGVSALMGRLQAAHSRRLTRLGLAS